MVKFSIIECRSGIDQHLLGNFLREHLGEENSRFVDLVQRFFGVGKNTDANL
jgi:hypothetical protein